MNLKTQNQINDAKEFFGEFKAEAWEADEFVITCKAGPIGQSIGRNVAKWLPGWLNSAMSEAVSKINKK